MSVDPVIKYSHQTIVARPLQNPEVAERAHLLKDPDHASLQYLQARRSGFIFIRWLKNDVKEHPEVAVGLFASADHPQELVVIKKLKHLLRFDHAADVRNPMSAEIEISSIADPLVQRQLPLYHCEMGQTPFAQLNAVQIHDWGTRKQEYQNFDATLFYKYYNGGTLWNLMEKYKEEQRTIPEGFVWHYVAEHGRALAWLHTGNVPSREYNVKHTADVGQGQRHAVNKLTPVRGWEAICHMDAHADNTWLHYPTDEEKAANPALKRFSDALPQVILGDFGIAMEARNDRNNVLQMRTSPDVPEPETVRDKADLGCNLLRLVVAGMSPDARRHIWQTTKTSAHMGSRRARVRPEHTLDPHMAGYSPELLTCYNGLRSLVEMRESNDFSGLLARSGPGEWATFATNDFVYGTVIAMADAYLDAYTGSGVEESVRWTQPSNTYMPYRALARWPRHHRWDWDTVNQQLTDYIRQSFTEHAPGSVGICQAHVIGAGTAEAELERVEFDEDYGPVFRDVQLPRKKTTPPRQHRPESLSDYVSERESAGVSARRAALVMAQDREPAEDSETAVRISPPATPPEYHERTRIDDAVYERKPRERLRAEARRGAGNRFEFMSLADGVSSRVVAAAGTTLGSARRAATLALRGGPSRGRPKISSPQTPPEYRRRRQRDDAVYEQNRRERLQIEAEAERRLGGL